MRIWVNNIWIHFSFVSLVSLKNLGKMVVKSLLVQISEITLMFFVVF